MRHYSRYIGLSLLLTLGIIALLTYNSPRQQSEIQTQLKTSEVKADPMKLQQILVNDYASSIHLFLANAETGIRQAIQNNTQKSNNPYIEKISIVNAQGIEIGNNKEMFSSSDQKKWLQQTKEKKDLFVSPVFKEADGKQYIYMMYPHIPGQWAVGKVNVQFMKKMLGEQADVMDGDGNSLLSTNAVKKGAHLQSQATANIPMSGWKVQMNGHLREYFALQSNRENYKKGSIIVQFKKPLTHSDVSSLKSKYGITLMKENGQFYEFHGDGMPTDEVIDRLERHRSVVSVHKNYYYEKQDITPNDEFYKTYQWNLRSIHAEKGWTPDKPTGNETIIAVLDTGVDYNHPEFKGKMVAGYNFIANNDQPLDDNGHGTHVAGVAAALTNNYQGIAGIALESKIMPVKVMNNEGAGDVFSIAQGVRWAADHGADVINLSLGDRATAPIFQEAINYALSKNIVIVAASGNESTNVPMYPAAYPGVIAVGAYNSVNQRSPFSNYGDHIEVSAPGENIPSTYLQGQYVALSGTSMASPHVAGFAALLRSLNPNASKDDIRQLILTTSVDMGTEGQDPYFGHGRIDIANAMANRPNGAGAEATNEGNKEKVRKPLEKRTLFDWLFGR